MMMKRWTDPKRIGIAVLAVSAFFLVFSFLPNIAAQSTGTTNLEAPAPSDLDTGNVAMSDFIVGILKTTGIYAFIYQNEPAVSPAGEAITIPGWQSLLMIGVGFLLLYLGVAKGFEPILLIPIGFGTILVNIPFAGMYGPHGFLRIIYESGVANEFFPLIIFMGIGALTDFGPLIANPKTALLGAAAQLGVFITFYGVAAFNLFPEFFNFSIRDACAISIIGGADGPTTIYIAQKLAPELLATVAVAAYSYMALVPLIQPPIMKLLTTKEERLIRMHQLRPVSKLERMMFPLIVLALSILLIPAAAPLIGCLAIGNFIREVGVVDRLSKTMQNELLNIASIFLSLGVGSQMTPDRFLQPSSLSIVVLGLFAFAVATAGGVLTAKFMNLFMKEKFNPLIGSAGVSAVPMAARVSNKVGQEADPTNYLLMHAMGPNVAGVIGTAVAAGVMIAIYAK